MRNVLQRTIDRVTDAFSDSPPDSGAPGDLLRVEGLSTAYGQSQILYEVGISVQAGQVVCLLGRNGVGKTTLIKSIMGLLPLRSGTVSLMGHDVTGWPPHRRAKIGVGYVPQGRGIFPHLSVHENLLIGLEAASDQGDDDGEIEAMYKLFPALKIDPNKLGGTLSGGQQQQLALARALVRRPRLLLLDEPTEGIQPSIVDEIGDLLVRLKAERGIAMLLVEQFLDFAFDVADGCYVMEKGAIVMNGDIGEIDLERVRSYLAV